MAQQSLHSTEFGQGEKIIVLLHGFPESKDVWRRLTPLLQEDFRVLCPDLPGAGNSPFEGAQLSVEDMARALADTLQDKGIHQPIVLAGHSMGGYVALAFADLFPEMLAGLSLVHSSCHSDSEEKILNRRKSIRLLEKGGKEVFVREMIPNLFGAAAKEKAPDLIQEQIKRGMDMPVQSMIRFYEAMIARPDRCRVLEQAPFPVQIIAGKEDNLIPVKESMAQARLPNRSLVSALAAGHMGMLETPQQVADDLRQFARYCFETA